jgi:acid phosphatase
VGSVERTTADGVYEVQSQGGGGGDKLKQHQNPPGHIRFGLSGCHDTTLAGALSSLGAYDTDAWPPFTSHIAIELFRDASTPPQQALPPSSDSLPSQSTTSWISSLFGLSSSSSSKPGTPPKGIGRKPTVDLSGREKQQLEGYYVRLRYNDKPVTIPGCKLPGNHLQGNESFCTLTAFKSIVDKFTPVDWRQQCRANINAPAFPSKPEPAGH